MFEALLTILFIGVVGFCFLVAVAVIFIYNSLVSKRNSVDNTFALVDVMLKKRHDLIPNLVSTVKGYMTHEAETFKKITELRSKAVSGDTPSGEKLQCENLLSSLLKSIFVSVENYPELKASENFMNLQKTMTELEEQISAARRTYNMQVLELNNACDMVPSSLVASVFGFKKREFFEASKSEEKNPDVAKILKK